MEHNDHAIGHAIPKSTIVGSYIALLVLAAFMVGLSRLPVEDFGIDWVDLHAVKASLVMFIALIMGIIVSMYLMGLRYDNKLLNLTIFLSNFVFLLIFVLFTWADNAFRGAVSPEFTESIDFQSPVKPGAGQGAPSMQAPAPGANQAAPAPSH